MVKEFMKQQGCTQRLFQKMRHCFQLRWSPHIRDMDFTFFINEGGTRPPRHLERKRTGHCYFVLSIPLMGPQLLPRKAGLKERRLKIVENNFGLLTIHLSIYSSIFECPLFQALYYVLEKDNKHGRKQSCPQELILQWVGIIHTPPQHTGKEFHKNPVEALGGSSNQDTRRMCSSVDSGELRVGGSMDSGFKLARVALGCPLSAV